MSQTNKKILIVDDSPVDREFVAIACYSLGCELICASGLAEALALARDHIFDLLLTDYRMEPNDGIAVIKTFRHQHPETNCLLMTAYPDLRAHMFVAEQGLLPVVLKPIRVKELVARMQSALRGEVVDRQQVGEVAFANAMDQCLPLTGSSPQLLAVRNHVAKLVESTEAFAIVGPDGVGKVDVAKFIHSYGSRADQQVLIYRLRIKDEATFERELLAEDASESTHTKPSGIGTLVLDNIETLSLPVQARLAKALKRLSQRFRVVAIFDECIDELLEQSLLDENLYFILAAQVLQLPPLDARLGDANLIADRLLKERQTAMASDERQKLKQELPRHLEENLRSLKAAILSHFEPSGK